MRGIVSFACFAAGGPKAVLELALMGLRQHSSRRGPIPMHFVQFLSSSFMLVLFRTGKNCVSECLLAAQSALIKKSHNVATMYSALQQG